MRMGSVPTYPPLVDLTAIPESLSEEDAAAIVALEADDDAEKGSTAGERVPIDVSGGD